MYGSWRWNLSIASLGLLIIFLIGLTNNPWSISLLRGAYSFVVFFLLAYLVRFVIGQLFNHQTPPAENELLEGEETTGVQIDYVTPDGEEDLNEILREQINQGNKANRAETEVEQQPPQAEQFQPLQPKKLVSTDKVQAEELTRAVRHLTGE